MQERNFILTDVMKTGDHQQLESFINFSDIPGQQFDMTGEWYTLQQYDLKIYTRRIAFIDHRKANERVWDNKNYWEDLEKRVEYLRQQDFVFVITNPWESRSNIEELHKIPFDKDCYYWYGEDSWFWWMMYNRYQGKTFEVDHSSKKYDFFYLNKYPRSHRVKLFNRLESLNLLKNSLYSFLSEGKRLDKEYELPWVNPMNYPKYGMDQDIYEKPYNHSAYNIVSETHDSGETFITEKIWKPILMQQIFVVHGKPHYLKELRELGFQTFNNTFDESYDTEENADKRLDKIINLCQWLKNQDAQKIYSLTEDIRKHNAAHFFNESALKKTVNKTVLGLLKFFDGSQVSSRER
jgi:hypothetical protein